MCDMGDTCDNSLVKAPPIRTGVDHNSVRGTEDRIGTRHGLRHEDGAQYVVYKDAQAMGQ